MLSLIGGGAGIPLYRTYGIPEKDIKMEKFDSTIKYWNNILSIIPGSNETEKVSMLFSKNLTTFSKSTVENVVKQLLMGWIIKMWKNQKDFYPISQKINKFFFDYHLNYWKSKNNLDDFSWGLIKNFFIDFFFKEKGWFLLNKFEDFRNFVFEQWKEQEKPFEIYEWNINYSTKGENSDIFNKPNNLAKEKEEIKNYLFPAFETIHSNYRQFILNLKNQKEIDSKYFQKKVLTISKLKEIKDGRKLASLLYLFNILENKNSTFSSNGDKLSELDLSNLRNKTNTNFEENPLLLFLEKLEENKNYTNQQKISGDCILVKKSIFKEDFWNKILEENRRSWWPSSNQYACLYGVRELKNKKSNEWGNDKFIISREKEGISIYGIPKKNQFSSISMDKLAKSDFENIEKFLNHNFENIFFKYLLSKKNGNGQTNLFFELKLDLMRAQKTDKLSFEEYFKKHSEIFGAIKEYLEKLYWVENIKNFSSILSSIYREVPSSFATHLPNNSANGDPQNKRIIVLNDEDGLFNPHPLIFGNKNSFSEEEIKFDNLRQKENKEKQNGNNHYVFYSKLFNSLIKNNIYGLEEKANKLKELLNKEGEKDFQIKSLENIFHSELLNRANLEKILENKSLLVNSVFSKKIEELLNVAANNEDENLAGQIKRFADFLNTNNENIENGEEKNKWENLINKTLFLDSWLSLPVEERAIFGNLQNNPEEGEEEKSTEDNGRKIDSWITKARNSWILRNFYLSDDAYESSSLNSRELISFLYSIYWLRKNNYSNLSKLTNHIFNKSFNKNSYLVWLKEINPETMEEIAKKLEDKNEDSSKPKNLLSNFTQSLPSEIQNPLLTGTTNFSKEEEKISSKKREFSFYKEIFEAQAIKNDVHGAEKNKLGGFMGLITPKFTTKEIPEELKTSIFEKFWINNDSKNTNFSSTEEENKGFLEGLFFEDNWKIHLQSNEELKTIFDSFKLKKKILKYLNLQDKTRPNPTLLQALAELFDSSQVEKDFDLEALTIGELKEKIKQVLENKQSGEQVSQTSETQDGKKNYKDFYRMWNRFSGFFRTLPDQKTPYIFTDKKGDKERHYLTFLFQVNQFDFLGENIDKLKEQLSEDTLDLLVALLASNTEAREWIYNNELIKQLNLIS
ncbi:DUF3713 domain-containing protein [Mycoplasma parvum]|uniref:Uncharacterized protein n=1 Tax=Mycoplasma parvum str. Indiana TaxID=1403316 RepID=U5NGA0_9MOLU|nr:DUF3713 domain-containing protein [Mycoplasma parvum]AGX89229.1 hypothetical protein PRV_02465 [Mycoplasma parvum str. Indiana]